MPHAIAVQTDELDTDKLSTRNIDAAIKTLRQMQYRIAYEEAEKRAVIERKLLDAPLWLALNKK